MVLSFKVIFKLTSKRQLVELHFPIDNIVCLIKEFRIADISCIETGAIIQDIVGHPFLKYHENDISTPPREVLTSKLIYDNIFMINLSDIKFRMFPSTSCKICLFQKT